MVFATNFHAGGFDLCDRTGHLYPLDSTKSILIRLWAGKEEKMFQLGAAAQMGKIIAECRRSAKRFFLAAAVGVTVLAMALYKFWG